MDENELNKLMLEKFGSVQLDKQERKFYLYYDILGRITGLSPRPMEGQEDNSQTFISKEKFDELAEEAKNNCPVSGVLNCEIKLNSTLI